MAGAPARGFGAARSRKGDATAGGGCTACRARYIGSANLTDGAEKMSDPASKARIPLENAVSAPTMIFDDVPLFGVIPGMGKVTLSVFINDDNGAGGVQQRQVAVLHLRGNEIAFRALRDAINNMKLMATPSQGGGQPN